MSEIRSLSVEPMNLPLTEPFTISLGTQHEASNLLVTAETTSGTVGYGEAPPLPPITGETQAGALEMVRAAADLLEGREIASYRALIADLRGTFAWAPAATFGIETAVIDAFCRERDLPLAELFGGTPTGVRTDQTIGIVSPSDAADYARRAVADGFEHLKIKTGKDVSEDVERVVSVHSAVPEASIKVDANQGWTPKETIQFANRVESQGVDIELIEQPVPKSDVSGLAVARRGVDVPIAADEAVFTPEDAIRVIREEAADVINVKLGKSGLLGAQTIAGIAKAANLELMIGCMLESTLGIHTSAHFVAGLGDFEYIDLDGNLALEEDVVSCSSGPIHDTSGPGHGIVPTKMLQ